MTLNPDMTDNMTRLYQRRMMLALRRTDLGQYIHSELPEIALDPAFCQWKARDLREDVHIKATRLFARTEVNETLSFATWVPRDAVSKEPLPSGPGELVQWFAKAAARTPISAIGAATELDFLADRRLWQTTVHAIICHPEKENFRDLSVKLTAALGGSKRQLLGAYRPLVVKPVHDLVGLIPYVFKQLSVIKTSQRSPWLNLEGRAYAPKQRLRTPQLYQLLRQTQRDGVTSRVLIGSISEVAQ